MHLGNRCTDSECNVHRGVLLVSKIFVSLLSPFRVAIRPLPIKWCRYRVFSRCFVLAKCNFTDLLLHNWLGAAVCHWISLFGFQLGVLIIFIKRRISRAQNIRLFLCTFVGRLSVQSTMHAHAKKKHTATAMKRRTFRVESVDVSSDNPKRRIDKSIILRLISFYCSVYKLQYTRRFFLTPSKEPTVV